MLSRRGLITGAAALAAYSQMGDAEAVNRLLLLGGVPSWIPNPANPPDFAINWALNQAWKKVGGLLTPTALGITTSRASVKQVRDAYGNWSQVAANVTATSALGRSTEEARTNSIPVNNMSGAVVGVLGSGGSLPTGWGVGYNGQPITGTVVGTGVENGINYVDVNFSGTVTGLAQIFLFTLGTTAAAASNGQNWASSAFLRMSGGSTSNISGVQVGFTDRQAGGAGGTYVAFSTNTISGLGVAGIGSNRLSVIGTISDASAAYAWQLLYVNSIAAGAINITLRIGWPQLELGASVTSPIVTSGSALTRAADLTTLSGVATTGAAVTLFSQAAPQTPIAYGATQPVIALSDGTLNNRFQLYRGTTGTDGLTTVIGGSTQTIGNGTTWAQNATGNLAASFASGNQVESFNANSVSGTLAGTLGGTTIYFGVRSDGGAFFDGLTLVDAVWLNQSVPSAQLRAMV